MLKKSRMRLTQSRKAAKIPSWHSLTFASLRDPLFRHALRGDQNEQCGCVDVPAHFPPLLVKMDQS